MFLALQDLRRLGVKKYINNTDYNYIYNEIIKLNNLTQHIKVSAYSLPRKWNNLDELTKTVYSSMTDFVLSCEPMLENIEVTEYTQRSVRNRYDAIWKDLQGILSLTDSDRELLKNFGIKLLFILNNEADMEISYLVIEFYNTLLKWVLFTQSENNLDKNSITLVKILEYLVDDNYSVFEEFLGRLVV